MKPDTRDLPIEKASTKWKFFFVWGISLTTQHGYYPSVTRKVTKAENYSIFFAIFLQLNGNAKQQKYTTVKRDFKT